MVHALERVATVAAESETTNDESGSEENSNVMARDVEVSLSLQGITMVKCES